MYTTRQSLFQTTPTPPRSTLFPYTTLFRSQRNGCNPRNGWRGDLRDRRHDGGWKSNQARSVHGLRHKGRSEEHTSELQSRPHLVCRLLLEKKKKIENRMFWRYV